MTEQFYIHTFDNGLTLLAERLDHVVSAAMCLAIPAGAGRDGVDKAGAAGVMSEWMFRGAGDRDSRALNDALDSLGCHHDESVHSTSMQLSFALTHQNCWKAMEIYGDIVRRPTLAAGTFEPCRDLALQDLAGIEDHPSRKCSMELRERFYPQPFGANAMGTSKALAAMTDESIRAHTQRHLTPHGSILAVAGRIEWEPLLAWVGDIFGTWEGSTLEEITPEDRPGGITQQTKDTAQVQIGLAYAAPRISDEHYYPARVAEMVLSGGMSGRLFTEVREKRGLVYSVGARYRGMKEAAGMFVYAGTAPERAQETLEVTVAELRKMAAGVSDDELARAKTQLKSALVMQGERTSARAGGLVGDWRLLGRLRSLDEIAAAIDAVTTGKVREVAEAYPAENFTAYFIGPEPLDTSCLQ